MLLPIPQSPAQTMIMVITVASILPSLIASPTSMCILKNPSGATLQPAMGVNAPNFPDPSLLTVDGVIYTFATSTTGVNVPISFQSQGKIMNMMTSARGKNAAYEAMPTLPKWSSGAVWAPDVVHLTNGSFVMYFSAALLAPHHSTHCIGVATSANVTGPYQPADSPLACPQSAGGAIDASGFQDSNGDRYVVYKVDGNSLSAGRENSGPCGNADGQFPTPIMLQQVSAADGFTPMGSPVEILDRDQRDGPLVEAPSLVRTANGVYVLFFSSNCFSGPLYDTSYATSQNLTGPYVKATAPLLMTGMRGLKSPGGATVSRDGKMLVWHADKKAGNSKVRQMYMSQIHIEGTKVQLSS